MRIKLKGFDHKSLDSSAVRIVDTVSVLVQGMGSVPLPTRIRRFCVLRSPFVNKDSREHFEITTHNRLIDIKSSTKSTIDSLMHLGLPGVDIEIKTV
ncbi:MAG: 30S ribosomal protein S10 [Deinococcales bacterium]